MVRLEGILVTELLQPRTDSKKGDQDDQERALLRVSPLPKWVEILLQLAEEAEACSASSKA